ncbi:MAG TPA: hypothetical protein VLL52_24670 [Anaerolineae bacterium]|nr:hypothetical protein [Anaerolineae bacterium]
MIERIREQHEKLKAEAKTKPLVIKDVEKLIQVLDGMRSKLGSEAARAELDQIKRYWERYLAEQLAPPDDISDVTAQEWTLLPETSGSVTSDDKWDEASLARLRRRLVLGTRFVFGVGGFAIVCFFVAYGFYTPFQEAFDNLADTPLFMLLYCVCGVPFITIGALGVFIGRVILQLLTED